MAGRGICVQAVVSREHYFTPCSPTTPAVLAPSMWAMERDEAVTLSVLTFLHLVPYRPESDHKPPFRLVHTRE